MSETVLFAPTKPTKKDIFRAVLAEMPKASNPELLAECNKRMLPWHTEVEPFQMNPQAIAQYKSEEKPKKAPAKKPAPKPALAMAEPKANGVHAATVDQLALVEVVPQLQELSRRFGKKVLVEAIEKTCFMY